MATQHKIYDFFEAQRRLRARSRVLIGGFFLLLWVIANAFLLAAHSRQSCAANGVCESQWYPNWWVMAITAGLVAAYLVLAPWVASHFMVAGPRIRPADGADAAIFRNVVEEVAIAAGVPAPRPYVLDDAALNAFAVSDGNRHGAVIITTGLLAALDRRELTGVVAHEIGHIRNRDSRVILVAVLAVGAVVAVAAAATAIAAGDRQGDERLQGQGLRRFPRRGPGPDRLRRRAGVALDRRSSGAPVTGRAVTAARAARRRLGGAVHA